MGSLKSLTDDALSQLKDQAKQGAKQILQTPVEVVKDAAGQVTGIDTTPSSANPQMEAMAKEQTQEFVKDLYAPTQEGVPLVSAQQKEQKAVEDKKKMEQLRQKLHQEYYEKLTTRPKTQEEVEKPAERVERLEMEDLQKKQEEDKKKKPIAVDRAERSTEAHRGASG